jgi:GTP cyclohydrolase I
MKPDLNSSAEVRSPLMPDVQGRADLRNLPIQRVGIKSLRYPLSVQVGGKLQPTVGTWTLDVALGAGQKGAHMSRLIAWLESLDVRGVPLTAASLGAEITAMLSLLEADAGRIEVSFPFFVRKAAPVSGLQSLMEYDGHWLAERVGGQTRLVMQAVVPVKSLCPCSKEVSDNGAHNQRSHISMRVELRDPAKAIDWTELVRFAEDNASSELWGLLKRPDEKWVTERAYANPKFVEDLIRDVAGALEADPRIGSYRVEVVNHESIHAHDAYAVIERQR